MKYVMVETANGSEEVVPESYLDIGAPQLVRLANREAKVMAHHTNKSPYKTTYSFKFLAENGYPFI